MTSLCHTYLHVFVCLLRVPLYQEVSAKTFRMFDSVNCTRSATWMVWPTGLGYFPPSYLCPGGAWRGRLLDTEVFCCPSFSPSAATAWSVGGRGRVYALPPWACVLSVAGTGVVISWEHRLHPRSV